MHISQQPLQFIIMAKDALDEQPTAYKPNDSQNHPDDNLPPPQPEEFPPANQEEIILSDEIAQLPDPSDTPPFSAPDMDAAYEALVSFYQEHRCLISLRAETGLPNYLYGNLQDPLSIHPKELLDVTAQFLHRQELMLSGLQEETHLQLTRQLLWEEEEGKQQIAFTQTNSRGIPLYGSGVACQYNGGRLVLVSSHLYPAQLEIIDELTWPEPMWLSEPYRLEDISQQEEKESQAFFPFNPVECVPPLDLSEAFHNETQTADQWIFPYQDGNNGVYRPVWRTIAVNETGEPWWIFVDAETEQILWRTPALSGASIPVRVFFNDTNAAGFYTEANPNNWPNFLVERTLDFGAGDTIHNADLVHIAGAVDPGNLAQVPFAALHTPPDENMRKRFLTANIFHHLRLMQIYARWVLVATQPQFPPGTPPWEDIQAEISDQPGEPSYNESTHAIYLPRGLAGAKPIQEPGLDPDVLYHEFTHAFLRYWNPAMFQFSSSISTEKTRQLDEGLAFFYACARSGDAGWARYAYEDEQWQAYRNLEQDPPNKAVSSDPSGSRYGWALRWARGFWKLRLTFSNFFALRLTIQAVQALSGSINQPEEFVVHLQAQAGNDLAPMVRACFEEVLS